MFDALSTKQIYQRLQAGQTIYADVNGVIAAQIFLSGSHYVMNGVTGAHSIAADVSDAARVAAHWWGFSVTNRAKLRGMIDRGEPLPGVIAK